METCRFPTCSTCSTEPTSTIAAWTGNAAAAMVTVAWVIETEMGWLSWSVWRLGWGMVSTAVAEGVVDDGGGGCVGRVSWRRDRGIVCFSTRAPLAPPSFSRVLRSFIRMPVCTDWWRRRL